jgi:micrococcal nuclease
METVANILTGALLFGLVLFVLTLSNKAKKFNKALFRTDIKKKLVIRYIVVLVALFIGIGITAPSQRSEPKAATNTTQETKPQLSNLYEVIEVVDGDTIKVSIDGKTETLRLIGIDTPETKDPRKPIQCFGQEASSNAKTLLEGKKVRLERDDSQSDRDKYDRLLRYVYLEDGTSYNKQIIADGYAHEYTYDLPYKYQAEFKQAQKDAEASDKGLWSSETCNGNTEQATEQKPSTTTQPQAVTPAPAVPTESQTANDCDPNYSGGCVPNVSYDLDCGDISFSVTVVGTDRHRFDRDGDGYGCESN